MNSPPANYLIVGPSWVGDMVMAQALFMDIKRREPNAEIDVLAPAWSLPIIKRMPEVRRGIAAPWAHGKLSLKSQWQLARTLKHYEVALVLPRSFKSALIPFFAGIPCRVGFSGEGRSLLLTDARKRRPTRNGKAILDKTVWRYMSLGVSPEEYSQYRFDVPIPHLQVDQENARSVMETLNLDYSRPIIAICPGAEFGPAKQWPLDYHRTLAERLCKQGYQVWIMGGPKDVEAGDHISAGIEHAHNLCGRTQLADTVDLFSLCQRVVSHDSGLMHVAAASGAPVVAIYGSTSPDFTPPLTDRASIVRHPLSCSPCFERTCRYGHYHCLTGISPEQVMTAIAPNGHTSLRRGL